MRIYSKVGNQKALFSLATTLWCRGGGTTPFRDLLHFTLDPSYLIMLSVKQGDIKYHFLR